MMSLLILGMIFGLGYLLGHRRSHGSGIKKYNSIVQEQEDHIKRLEKLIRGLGQMKESAAVGYTVLCSGGLAMISHHLHLEILDARGWNFSLWELFSHQISDFRYAALVFLFAVLYLRLFRSLVSRLQCRLLRRLAAHESTRISAIDSLIQYLGPELSEAITSKLLHEGIGERQALKTQLEAYKREIAVLSGQSTIKDSQVAAYRHFEDQVGAFVWCGDCTSTLCREDPLPKTPKSMTDQVFTFKADLQKTSMSSTKSDTRNLETADREAPVELSEKSAFTRSLHKNLHLSEEADRSLTNLLVPMVCRKQCVQRFVRRFHGLQADLQLRLLADGGTI